MDLREDLGRALDGGPAHRAIEERLALGRRATRRRRTAMGASVLAMVAVVGGIGWAVLPGDGADTGASDSIATEPTTPAPIEPLADAATPPAILGDLASTPGTPGELTLAPGAVIEHEVHNPSTDPRATSAAAIATFEGKTWWVMTAGRKSGAGWISATEATERTFEQWVHEMNVYNDKSDAPGTDQWGGLDTGWVTLGDDGVLTPRPDVSILEQAVVTQTDDMPDDGPSATATIEVEGGRFCVYAEPKTSRAPGNYYTSEAADPGCVKASVRPAYAISDEDPERDHVCVSSSIDDPEATEMPCAEVPVMTGSPSISGSR